MSFPELNLDRLLPPSLLSIFSPRKKSSPQVEPPKAFIEVHPDFDKKISKISETSTDVYSTVRQNGDRPFGDMWAEVYLFTPETTYWIQADDAGSLVINTTSAETRHGLRIQTNDLKAPVLYSEIRYKETSQIETEVSITRPEDYNYDGLYEACRLVCRCNSLLRDLYPPERIDSGSVFSRTDIVNAIK